jgi:Fur family transcriptional regulator, ferric uptake regulator
MEAGSDVSRLRSVGMTPTGPRRSVLSALRGRGAPASANEVYDDLRVSGVRIGLTTVYRILRLFAQQGLVHSFAGSERRYRMCTQAPHVHLVCECCEGVFEQLVGPEVPWLPGSGQGFTIDLQSTVLNGFCALCQSARVDARPSGETGGAPAQVWGIATEFYNQPMTHRLAVISDAARKGCCSAMRDVRR